MADDKNLREAYVSLDAGKASLFDLVRILISSRFRERDFCDIPDSEEADKFLELQYRWIVFASVLLQKLLIFWRTPMAWFGELLELWMNLLNSNSGLAGLFANVLRVNVVIPDRSSAKFTSVVGNVDRRFELDPTAQYNDHKFYSYMGMMASKLTYENESFVRTAVRQKWKMEFVGYYNFWNDYLQMYNTVAIILHDKGSNTIVVAFRGTPPFDADAWRTDVDVSWFEIKGVGKVHSGFMKALGLQRQVPKEVENDPSLPPRAYYALREKLKDLLGANEGSKLVITGHSLGAALAILFASVLSYHDEELLLDRLEGVYTYGQPRVGDSRFGKFMSDKFEKYDVRYFRYVYCHDMVPRVPFDDKNQWFKHFGTCLYYSSFYGGKVVEEVMNKNYFSLVWFVPYRLNAVWELGRGVVLARVWGDEFKEGWATRLLRAIGLGIPGLSAHFPQDYVNLILLGRNLSSRIG